MTDKEKTSELPRTLSPAVEHAAKLAVLTTEELGAVRTAAELKFMGITASGGYDPSNTEHVQARTELIGAGFALSDRMADQPASKKPGDDTPPSAGAMAIRIDGGIDVISAPGVQELESTGYPSPENVMQSFDPQPASQAAPVQSRPQPTLPSPGIRRIMM